MPPSPAMGPADALRMISPDLKLSLTLAVILISGLIPWEHWPAHGLLMVVVFAAAEFCRSAVSLFDASPDALFTDAAGFRFVCSDHANR